MTPGPGWKTNPYCVLVRAVSIVATRISDIETEDLAIRKLRRAWRRSDPSQGSIHLFNQVPQLPSDLSSNSTAQLTLFGILRRLAAASVELNVAPTVLIAKNRREARRHLGTASRSLVTLLMTLIKAMSRLASTQLQPGRETRWGRVPCSVRCRRQTTVPLPVRSARTDPDPPVEALLR